MHNSIERNPNTICANSDRKTSIQWNEVKNSFKESIIDTYFCPPYQISKLQYKRDVKDHMIFIKFMHTSIIMIYNGNL